MSAPISTPSARPGHPQHHTYSSSPRSQSGYPSQTSSYQQQSQHLSSSPHHHQQPQPQHQQPFSSSPYGHDQYFPNQQQHHFTTPQDSSSPSKPSHLGPNAAVIAHPTQQPQLSHSSLQRYQESQLVGAKPHHPGYDRQVSHQSHQSHHSHHSRHSHQSAEQREREMERRPSFGDTLSLMWNAVAGALSGKRR